MSRCRDKHLGKVGSWLINGTIVDTEEQRLPWLESWLENSGRKVDIYIHKNHWIFCIYLHLNF